MFNKIYEKIKSFMKAYYKELLIYLIIIVVMTFPLPYYIYVGGGIIDLNERISLRGSEKGSYNMAYVKQLHATIPTYLLSYIIPTWDLENVNDVKFDESENANDIEKREKLYLEEANTHAIINAYKLSGFNISIKSNEYKVIYVSNKANTNVKVGDALISVDNHNINNNTDYKEYLKTLPVGSKLNVKVLRNNKEVDCYAYLIDLEGEKLIGLYLVNIYDYEVDPKIDLKFNRYESGPSGGFMLSLAIYDRLLESVDLTKGRKIVGTGTIDANGNIGEIGGVKYKLIGAVNDKAEIFFVPEENYEEAISVKKKFNYKINVIKVKTLQDAINYLKNN